MNINKSKLKNGSELKVDSYTRTMLILLCIIMIVWYSYTWAIIGYFVGTFGDKVTSTVVGVVKIITCLLIAIAFGWMFYLSLVLWRRYRGFTHAKVTTRGGHTP